MPLATKLLKRNRVEFDGKLTASEVAPLREDKDLRVLRASPKAEPRTNSLLTKLPVKASINVNTFDTPIGKLSGYPLSAVH